MSAPKAALAPLTSVRFLAAFRVALYHFVDWESKTYWWRGLMLAPISVSYFFVSSGFLLAYNYADRVDRREMNYRSFYLGRCARLLPVYYLGLLVALPLLFWPVADFSLRKAAFTVFLLQSWSPYMALYWNPPAWALSTLGFFYASLPLWLILTRSISKRTCWSLALLSWAISLTLSLVYVHWNPDGLHDINNHTTAYWLYVLKYHPLVRLPEFFVGIMAGRLFLLTGGFQPKTSTAVFLAGSVLLLAALLLGDMLPYPVINCGLLAPLLAVLVVSLASGGLGADLLRHKWLVMLGQSSFCLYMLHIPIWNFLHQVLAPYGDLSHAANLLILAAIVLLSLLLYRLVELPATAALRALLVLPSRPTRAPAPAIPN